MFGKGLRDSVRNICSEQMFGTDNVRKGAQRQCSEQMFGTDVRNRQCSEQCSEPTQSLILVKSILVKFLLIFDYLGDISYASRGLYGKV